MKIKRFTNINEDINHLGDKWTKEKFDYIKKLKSEIENEEDSLKLLIKDYLILNPDIQEQIMDLDEYDFYITGFEYTPSETIVFSIWYDYDIESNYEATLNKNGFDDFLQYLKNPELYVNSKKYNI